MENPSWTELLQLVTETVDGLKKRKAVLLAFELEHDVIESQQVPWEFLYFIGWDIANMSTTGTHSIFSQEKVFKFIKYQPEKPCEFIGTK